METWGLLSSLLYDMHDGRPIWAEKGRTCRGLEMTVLLSQKIRCGVVK
ncbi:hypothetical protein B4109_2788 [Geobacillus stearothermophilus]|uniref:Uncharacterized protein n=1 Tax=Geobacillus stearothermophilus TaxID=1422 RepID=A0A150MSE0_GEOSE|nr:hypothetical protein B4109_2788 [Geobacillus stearothermophilus]